ncbi:hypothetical protein VH12019_00066 [Vibrio phage VH1_2019]|uniref:Uncharacterized protein n=1 Tax=Vibrio phage VH1_2019 TaxID=2686307 RepID=A0A6B9STF1_9CAUD|nr:hypothetical protein VH12019_00066 [Vibrio phage VH1_2019]
MGIIWISNIAIVVATLLVTFIIKCVFMVDIGWERYLDKLQRFKYAHLFTREVHEYFEDHKHDDMPFWCFSFIIIDIVCLGVLWLIAHFAPVVAVIVLLLALIRIIVIKVKKC